MKLVRFGEYERERPGIVDRDGEIRDVSSLVPDYCGTYLSSASLDRLRAADVTGLPRVRDARLGAPVAQVRHFIAVGLNYADHAAEAGASIPTEPILFNKAPSCIVGPDDDIVIPRGSSKTDWEVELAVVIGAPASYVSIKDAPNVIAGFTVCNDVSERSFQLDRGGQWMKGKGCMSFGPLGPWLVTADEIQDTGNLSLWLDLNGERKQQGSTRHMIFGIAHLISYISSFMRLEAGDVVTTGTPPGVGMGCKPPRYLRAGDQLQLGIDGLGVQTHNVVGAT
ncbi:MAG: fumarylacetoacetate hydrolase family protein [Proteobacteria bacterium]|nr:fumarylacetoacetate hydrolase family protein [Pseudomonadota bacterium]